MRQIERTTLFRRDVRRVERARHSDLDKRLAEAVVTLASDVALPWRYRDHPLTGDWVGFRECHLKPDLLLIYEKPDSLTLRLIRLGSHSELFK